MSSCPIESYLHGLSICRGVAIGKPFFLDREEIMICDPLLETDAPTEVKRYQYAMEKSIGAIESLQKQLAMEASLDGVKILESQLEILKDPLLNEEIEKRIFAESKSAESILQQMLEQIKLKFKAMPRS